jgi:hypothetical protein
MTKFLTIITTLNELQILLNMKKHIQTQNVAETLI